MTQAEQKRATCAQSVLPRLRVLSGAFFNLLFFFIYLKAKCIYYIKYMRTSTAHTHTHKDIARFGKGSTTQGNIFNITSERNDKVIFMVRKGRVC